jgi:hypothetical protein
MKLAEHVDKIRDLIHKSFFNYFARLGITAKKQKDIEEISEEQIPKRKKLDRIIKNHSGETGSFVASYEKALDEYTFTLFNRIAAIKVMEAHMMFPEVITKRPEQGNRSFAHRAWLERNRDMAGEELEGIREFIKFEFNKLGEKIPLYHKDYHYALLPYVIELNEIIDSFNEVEKDSDIDDNIWQSDDILGWLYESYNNVKKKEHKASDKKTEYDKVSLQSQVYTPRWAVKFLVDNSLGKLYLEMYPDSEIKEKYKIANAPATRVRDEKPLNEVKIIDPATGSGNFLYYAFDLFYDLYSDQIDNYGADYDEDNIPKTIIENNLYGIDLDDRAVQIAQLGLYIKAMLKNREVYIEKFNVVSSDIFLPDYAEVDDIFEQELLDQETKDLIKETWADLQLAYKFGSLVKIEEKVNRKINEIKEIAKSTSFGLDSLLKKWENWKETVIPQLFKAVDETTVKTGDPFLGIKTKDALTFLTILNTKYDVAVANPPYTDSADFGPELKRFIENNFKKPYKFHTNLYASFIKRCFELTCDTGFVAMIHPHTFMFIKTFEDVRKFLVNKTHIDLMVDYGLDRVNLFGPGILLDATFYVLSKSVSEIPGVYFNLTTNLQEKYKKEKFHEGLDDYLNGEKNDRVYNLEQSKLEIIESWPFIYWISDEFREKFKSSSLEKVAKVVSGIKTGNNNGALRFWWEVNNNDIYNNEKEEVRWVFYAKGGPFCKWFGNNWLCINWKDDGQFIRQQTNYNLIPNGYSFKRGITYSGSGSKGINFRFLDNHLLFDMGSSAVFPTQEIFFCLGVLNSKLAYYITDCLNPTVNKQTNDVKRIPLPPATENQVQFIKLFSERNVTIKKNLQKFSIIEHNYSQSPLQLIKSNKSDLKSTLKLFFNYENYLHTHILINEAIINEKVFEVYELTLEDKAMVLAKEGESVGIYHINSEAKQAYLIEELATKEFPLDNIREFIKNLPEKKFTSEEKKMVTEGFPALYQKNNDFEEFCIRNKINPINVWYWFKESNVVPKQRMNDIAMEFLADLIRKILMEDEDGIAPLVRSSGEEILINRIEKKFIEKGFSSAQFSQFDKVLGRELDDYLSDYFFKAFSDHLNLFMYLPKTPFIWHITSGPNHGFDAYIIIYKWNRDRLFSLKSVYIEKRETALRNRRSDLQSDDSAKAQNEKDLIFKQLNEIENLKTKIDELLAEGYDPVLDDGVGKNIAPLQKKGIISYDVLNKGQLKKYLNADW